MLYFTLLIMCCMAVAFRVMSRVQPDDSGTVGHLVWPMEWKLLMSDATRAGPWEVVESYSETEDVL